MTDQEKALRVEAFLKEYDALCQKYKMTIMPTIQLVNLPDNKKPDVNIITGSKHSA